MSVNNNITMKALLESGVHFGHRTNMWNPRMRPYIFTERNGIHIIDLQQTVKALGVAMAVVRDTVARGGTVLFVGTKRQAVETIQEEATRCGMPYVVERWLGGMITNWPTIYQRIHELERLENMRDSGEINRLPKKERLHIEHEIDRLQLRLGGLRNLKRLPDVLFVVDICREATAVHEANLKGIPVLAMVDTNCDPSGVDYVIPANDDAIRAIKLLVGAIADAAQEGMDMRKGEAVEQAPAGEEAPAIVRPAVSSLLEEEGEIPEEELLGEATLEKLSRARRGVTGTPEEEPGEEEEFSGEVLEENPEENPEELSESEDLAESNALDQAPSAEGEVPPAEEGSQGDEQEEEKPAE
jgi:small subunit ribosomal protein S2